MSFQSRPHDTASRRTFLRVMGGTAATIALPVSMRAMAASSPDLSKVTLNVLKYDGAPENFFSDAGIPEAAYHINPVKLAPGGDTITGLASGDLDLALTSQIPPLLANLRHLPLTSIAVLQRDVDNNVTTGAILVTGNSAIRRPEDLKGKRVAYLRTAVQNYVLLKVLDSAGLTLADIEPVALTNPDSFAAFKSGAVDAWSAWGTLSVLAQERFGARVLVPASRYYNGYDVLSSSHRTLADPLKRLALLEHLRRQRLFYAWREAHPEQWAKASSAKTGVDPATYLKLYAQRGVPTRLTGVSDEVLSSQRDIVATFQRAHLIEGQIDVASIWDTSFGKQLG